MHIEVSVKILLWRDYGNSLLCVFNLLFTIDIVCIPKYNKNNYYIWEHIIEDEVIQGMGIYFNPNNESYKRARNSQIYVDKTGLIEYLNKRLSTEENCIALSHGRRFG